MRTTIVGPYPRIGSNAGDILRQRINDSYLRKSSIGEVQRLQRNLTHEVLGELVGAGIDIPNTGLVDVHDELTWPLEYANGIEFGGMKKIFHTNTHYREAKVVGEISPRTKPTELYEEARKNFPQIKLELPGPYTLAQHSVLTENSPYKNLNDLIHAYVDLLRSWISRVSAPLIQFNEPSLIQGEFPHQLRNVYERLVDGIQFPIAVWTFYGKYSSELLSELFSLPVDIIGLDCVWDTELDQHLRRQKPDKGIGFGIVDSGDRGYIVLEDPQQIVERLKRLEGYVDFNRSLVSSNATLEHLPREVARKKLQIISEVRL